MFLGKATLHLAKTMPLVGKRVSNWRENSAALLKTCKWLLAMTVWKSNEILSLFLFRFLWCKATLRCDFYSENKQENCVESGRFIQGTDMLCSVYQMQSLKDWGAHIFCAHQRLDCMTKIYSPQVQKTSASNKGLQKL